ncbi:PhzF family phenazine biosynthesis protein [Propionibacterium sp.]|uniref:PhzF family phenazine biosynthesis protein n=1 Tax=Propionibacterium sp. TaxID=1977903 RepID=UPI0039EB84AB
MVPRRFSQVDVFSEHPLGGNPVAVVHDADGLSEGQMAAFARWTNLSETTFLLAPTVSAADYRLRIFTPSGELSFAGHPTLGSAHAWLTAHDPDRRGQLMQECAAGLVELEAGADNVAFVAPPLIHGDVADDEDIAVAARLLDVQPDRILDARWADNGPGFLGVLVADAAAVLSLRPRLAEAWPWPIGVVGTHAPDGPADVEVRVFCPGLGVPEDPVTGSFNAAAAPWLLERGTVASPYTVAQGTLLERTGRLNIRRDGAGRVWVAGRTITLIEGTVRI